MTLSANTSRMRVVIRPPREADLQEFLSLVRRSRNLHRSWVTPPDTPAKFRRYLARTQDPSFRGFLVCLRPGGEIAGVVDVSEIVRGCFRSAYLSYYVFAPYARNGYMTEGLGRVITNAFRVLRLHRLEANIRPANEQSIALVRRLGFRREGFSRRYLKLGGRWRDHERWAILVEEWRRAGRDS